MVKWDRTKVVFGELMCLMRTRRRVCADGARMEQGECLFHGTKYTCISKGKGAMGTTLLVANIARCLLVEALNF